MHWQSRCARRAVLSTFFPPTSASESSLPGLSQPDDEAGLVLAALPNSGFAVGKRSRLIPVSESSDSQRGSGMNHYGRMLLIIKVLMSH